MGDLFLSTQGTPTTPGAGNSILYPDSSSKRYTSKDENGRCLSLDGVIRNWNTADVVANAADTYLTGSNLAVPQHLLQAGATFKWRFAATKTAAGVATPIWNVRVGTLGTVVDTARLTFTGPAQTAVIDAGYIEITAVLRNTGAAGVLAGVLSLSHNLSVTGFSTAQCPTLQVTSSGFDTTVANLIVGVSCNPGAAGVWTHQLIIAEMSNM
jgi:hypothetical protein